MMLLIRAIYWLRVFEIVYAGVTHKSVMLFPIRCLSIVTVYCIISLFCVQLLCYQYKAYCKPQYFVHNKFKKIIFPSVKCPKMTLLGKGGSVLEFLNTQKQILRQSSSFKRSLNPNNFREQRSQLLFLVLDRCLLNDIYLGIHILSKAGLFRRQPRIFPFHL